MRLVVAEFLSLDGVAQAPGGPDEDIEAGFVHGGWSMPYFDPDTMGESFDSTLGAASVLLFGRKTWQSMASAWPDRAGDPFADRMNAIRKYVVSGTLTPDDLGWKNSVLVPSTDHLETIRTFKDDPGEDMVVMGSTELVRSLADADVIDEYRLMIEPILLGGGKRIFPTTGARIPLRLTSVVTASTGVLICSYSPQR